MVNGQRYQEKSESNSGPPFSNSTLSTNREIMYAGNNNCRLKANWWIFIREVLDETRSHNSRSWPSKKRGPTNTLYSALSTPWLNAGGTVYGWRDSVGATNGATKVQFECARFIGKNFPANAVVTFELDGDSRLHTTSDVSTENSFSLSGNTCMCSNSSEVQVEQLDLELG